MPKNSLTGKVPDTYDYSYVVGEHCLPEGWFELFLQMCEDIREPLEKAGCLDRFRFLDVKEKYGSMRLYSSGATEEVQDILFKYEFLSQQVCCLCGKPATLETDGYICPYCDECVAKSGESLDSAVSIRIRTHYTRTRYHDGEETSAVVSVEDEWNRYLGRIGVTT
jgi:hypothetical protein